MNTSRVVMLCAFPPPVGGAAKNNQILYQSLLSAGVQTVQLDTSAASLSHRRSLSFHQQRLQRNFCALLQARRMAGRDATLYLVPNGGAGLWYTLAQTKISAKHYRQVMLHHRSCAYVARHDHRMDKIVGACRSNAIHVFLSQGMAETFQMRYGAVETMVAGNAGFVSTEAAAAPKPRVDGPLVVGHLSNLCREKGFFDAAATYERVRAMGIDARLHLAGSIIEPAVAALLDRLQKQYGEMVLYCGPLSGNKKRDFYRSLDLFLFPTRFEQEASPNVIYEALAAGVPVLSTPRGCIIEMVSGEGGAVCELHENFSAFAADWISGFSWTAARRLKRSLAIKAQMMKECELARTQYSRLMSLLGADETAYLKQEF